MVPEREMVEGPCVRTMQFSDKDIPYFYRAGAMIPLNPQSVKRVTDKPSQMVLDVVAGENGDDILYEDEGDNSDYATRFATTQLRHNVDGKTETCVIAPRQGDATNLVERRSWTVNLLNAASPAEVRVNGKIIDQSGWDYNAAERKLSVRLPETNCDTPSEVIVRYR